MRVHQTFKKEQHMNFGVVMRTDVDLPSIAKLAQEAEGAGWDGFFIWDSFARFGEVVDRKIRAELLDESIDILHGLWSGRLFSFTGKHYRVHDATFQLTPVQSPRIPIWVVGAWPRQKSMRRVLRCDGILPVKMTAEGISYTITPEDIRSIKAFVDERRELPTPFNIVMERETPGDDSAKASAIVIPLAEAGKAVFQLPMYVNAWLMFRAVADFNAIGYHCFGVESILAEDGTIRLEAQQVVDSFRCLVAVIPLLLKYQGTGKIHAVVQEENLDVQILALEGYLGKIQFGPRPWRGEEDKIERRGRGLVIQTGLHEFYLAGDHFQLYLRRKLPLDGAVEPALTAIYFALPMHHTVSVGLAAGEVGKTDRSHA